MAESNIDSKMKDLNINQKSDINILLLGCTGVGKSTMINSFANYLTYGDLKKAKKEKLMVLIPTQFNVQDKHGRSHTVHTGEADNNEFLQIGESATQDVKTYVFSIWNNNIKVRLIDTPGMGDTRGIVQDDINSENILSYIANLHELHAICFLMKPNESRDTVFFKYCINQIFSRLDKSASDNIIFCFTNTRGSDYSPGETVSILKKTIEEIGNRPPYAKIPFNRNIFCFDNEPFRYLAAVNKDIEFDSEIKERNKESWTKSSEQCWKLIKYLTGDRDNRPLKPHFMKSTNAINEARRMINQLAQPLAEITQLIHHNMNVLNRHRDLLKHDNASLEEMKKKLFMPVIASETVNLTQPVTVCTTRKCADILTVAGTNVWHYKTRCHDPCYLNGIEKEMVGSPGLINCAAMAGTETCQKCFCDFKVHMHVYYLTKLVEKQEKDENMQKKITNRQELMEEKQKIMDSIEKRQQELDGEHQIVVETCAKFTHFLQNNAITPFNDAYKDYIEYIINREQSLGPLCNQETIGHLRKLLKQYVEVKNRFDEALKSSRLIGRTEVITSKEIGECIQTLYKLKHNGKKIKELYDCQKKSRNKEFQNTEYVHKAPFKPKDQKEKKVKEQDKKDKKEKDKERDKKDKDSKNKDNKERRTDNRNRGQNRGPARNETHRTGNSTPPPSYQEIHNPQRNQNAPNFNSPYPNYYNQFPNQPYSPYGPPGLAGYQPQYPFPPQGVNYKGAEADLREYNVNISFKKGNEPTVSTNPAHVPHPNYPPYNNPPYNQPVPLLSHPVPNPNVSHYPHPPAPYQQPYPQGYDHHHGVNRHNYGGPNHGNRDNGRGGSRGRGVHKRTSSKKGGSDNNEKQVKHEKKPPKKQEKKVSSDSSDSDSTD